MSTKTSLERADFSRPTAEIIEVSFRPARRKFSLLRLVSWAAVLVFCSAFWAMVFIEARAALHLN